MRIARGKTLIKRIENGLYIFWNMNLKNNISTNWNTLLNELLQNGKSVAIGTFDLSGQLLTANAALCYFLDADSQTLKPKNSFVNPEFSTFISNGDSELVFEGLITIGNQRDKSYVLSSKVFRRDDTILLFAEVDVPLLFEENKKMSVLNQEVNNLQRQLIKEKKTLQHTLEELRETQLMLIHSEKMNALGKLVAGVAHEINNPISFVYSNLYSIEKYVSEVLESNREVNELIQLKASENLIDAIAKILRKNDTSELLADIGDMTSESKIGIERVKTIVSDLRKFSRLDEAEMKEIDLIENIKSTVNIVHSEIARKEIDFTLVAPDKLMVECYPGQLNQAIMNVLMNAIDSVNLTGRMNLLVSEENGNVSITISDNGNGISDEIKDKIFDPFFTTKPVGSGVGLGLSITYKIIHELHHGSIEVNSLPNKNTSMKLTIPIKIK